MKLCFPSIGPAYRRLAALAVHRDPEHLWRRLVRRLVSQQHDIFFVQVGAMDGVLFDPLHEYVVRHNWRGLLIEPLSDIFAELKQTYDGREGLLFENVAIADQSGHRDMLRICREAIDDGKVPCWAKGVSTFTEPRNMLGPNSLHKSELEQMRPFIKTETVWCERLEAVFAKHNVRSIDVFVTDVEGYDYDVIKQLDLMTYSPSLIRIEWANLSEVHKHLTMEHLQQYGYRTKLVKLDLVAWKGRG
jgi:FkbM family methyltransferase